MNACERSQSVLQGGPQQQGGFGNPQRMVTVDTGAQQGQPGMGPILLLPPEFLAQQQVLAPALHTSMMHTHLQNPNCLLYTSAWVVASYHVLSVYS